MKNLIRTEKGLVEAKRRESVLVLLMERGYVEVREGSPASKI